MDIITHAGIGLIAAAPLLNSHPELALGLVAGSVLPDLDAVGRVLGKRAYLKLHQTWSHALPLQALFSMLTGCLASLLGAAGLWLGLGLFVGFAVHTALDFSNTLGVTLLAPFSSKRFCLEWVFFIDAFVLILTFVSTCFSLWLFYADGEVPTRYAAIFFGILTFYFGFKGILRFRAGRTAADAISLVPSALWPWRFFGVTERGNRVARFLVNALTGRRILLAEQEFLDTSFADVLTGIPEFRLMRELSPSYHVVNAEESQGGTLLVCRDLRTRNFGTTFGDLELLLDANNNVIRTKFHV